MEFTSQNKKFGKILRKRTSRVNGAISSRAAHIIDIAENPWIAAVVGLVCYLLPFLLFLYFTEQAVNDTVKEFTHEAITGWIDKHRLGIIVAVGLLLALYHGIPKLARRLVKPEQGVTVESALVLLHCLSNIVDAKAVRFGSAYQEFSTNNGLGGKDQVFRSITQPDQQIHFIVVAIHTFLEEITDDIHFQVRLIDVNKSTPKSWYTFAPKDAKPERPISDLNKDGSALKLCIKKREIVVVPDIVKEAAKRTGRRYLMLDDNDKGSICCYPIYHSATKTWPYVLTIKASKPSYFSENKKGYYKWLLSQFAARIEIEHSLRLLKEDH